MHGEAETIIRAPAELLLTLANLKSAAEIEL